MAEKWPMKPPPRAAAPLLRYAGGVQPEDDTTTQKFDWECAACGYKWEDDGVESKS